MGWMGGWGKRAGRAGSRLGSLWPAQRLGGGAGRLGAGVGPAGRHAGSSFSLRTTVTAAKQCFRNLDSSLLPQRQSEKEYRKGLLPCGLRGSCCRFVRRALREAGVAVARGVPSRARPLRREARALGSSRQRAWHSGGRGRLEKRPALQEDRCVCARAYLLCILILGQHCPLSTGRVRFVGKRPAILQNP